jgi:hypothetical protein
MRRPFSDFQADPRFADMVVFAVEGGAGSGSSRFVGAIDNIEVVGPLASVSANFEVVPPTASIQCDKAQLLDSEGQTSICTLRLSRPAEAALNIVLNTSGDTSRYSGCAGPLEIAAGANTASCMITATANTVRGDGQVTVSVAIEPAATADDYSLLAGASVASIHIADDDEVVAAPVVLPPAAAVPVPGLSGAMLAVLSMGLVGCGAFTSRRITPRT